MFLALQQELNEAGIGEESSLEDQLRTIETDLNGYFHNDNHLSQALGIGGLTYEHAFLKRTRAWSAPILSKLLEGYRNASEIDGNRLFHTLANLQKTLLRASGHFVSVAMLDRMTVRSKTQVFAKNCFRNIGDMIESSLFPFLKLRLNVLRFASGTIRGSRDACDLSLGSTVAELVATDPELYSPAPPNVPLSQWRNIAFHGSYNVRGESIRCRFGNRHLNQFECTPTQLLDTVRYVNDVYYVHKAAYELYSIDNVDKLLQVIKVSNQNDEALDLDLDFNNDAIFAYSIVACGFRIRKAGRRGVYWRLVLLDLHGRTKTGCEMVLKKALAPYLIHLRSLHLEALIQSRDTTHHLSFRGELTSSSRQFLPGEHSPYKLGKNFRVDDSSDS
ncbi:MAG: hypothetical protein OXI73_02615 [Rhodospirillales bacterium]|nr:hypothetical protein [Rhodospirillales bacterium]